MKIVKFKDGKYAIRKWTILGYKFLDKYDDYWWDISLKSGTSFNTYEECFNRLNGYYDYGNPIKKK